MSLMRKMLAMACPVVLFGMGAVQLTRQILLHYPSTVHLCGRIDWYLDLLPWISVCAAWALVMFLPLAVFFLWVESLSSKNLLVLTSEGGHPLKIRERAINQYIHDDIMTLPFVRSAQIVSRAASGALVLKVRVWVTSVGPLDGLQQRMLDRLNGAACKGLGISRVADIDLRFEAVRMTRAEAKKRAAEGKREAGPDLLPGPNESAASPFASPESENKTDEAGQSSILWEEERKEG
jgi:hypothetical protein